MNAGVAQLVECNLAKVDVEGSSPFTRSKHSLDLSPSRCYISIMEQLVIYFTASDGCSYSYEQSIPVEYESAEQLVVDLDAALIDWRDTPWRGRENEITVEHLTFDVDVFQRREDGNTIYEVPEILTLAEWFEKAKSDEV